MTKRQLIDEILEINRSARPAFLAQFNDEQLNAYLAHLHAAHGPAAAPPCRPERDAGVALADARRHPGGRLDEPPPRTPRVWRSDRVTYEPMAPTPRPARPERPSDDSGEYVVENVSIEVAPVATRLTTPPASQDERVVVGPGAESMQPAAPAAALAASEPAPPADAALPAADPEPQAAGGVEETFLF